jgi:hypothetical protein
MAIMRYMTVDRTTTRDAQPDAGTIVRDAITKARRLFTPAQRDHARRFDKQVVCGSPDKGVDWDF